MISSIPGPSGPTNLRRKFRAARAPQIHRDFNEPSQRLLTLSGYDVSMPAQTHSPIYLSKTRFSAGARHLRLTASQASTIAARAVAIAAVTTILLAKIEVATAPTASPAPVMTKSSDEKTIAAIDEIRADAKLDQAEF